MLAPIGRRTEGLVRVVADADDVAIAQGIIQSGQRVFYVLGGDGLAALFVGHIEHHAAAEIPLQGALVDPAGGLTAGSRSIMPWRIHMCPRMGGGPDTLCGPAAAPVQILRTTAEISADQGDGILVIQIFDLSRQACGQFRVHLFRVRGLDGDGQIHQPVVFQQFH